MKKLLRYLPFHFLVCFIIGIYLQFSFEIYHFRKLFLIIIFGLLVLFLLVFHQLKQKFLFTFFSWIFFFSLGFSTVFYQNDLNKENYYQHFIENDFTSVLQIKKILKASDFSDKYEAEVIQANQQKTVGKVLLNIQKDSMKNELDVDDKIVVKSTFEEVNSPRNPHQFNYKEYLEKQGIYQQVFLHKSEFKIIKNTELTGLGFAHKIRENIRESLYKYSFSKDELAVISALLLGQRQDISKELIDEYSKAGAIHILAVSGLHIGIILLILSWLFTPIESFKKGKLLKAVLIVLFLWMFAIFAGLSASVVRAVTMFTFLAIGTVFQSKKVIEYSLISSMFLLLLIKPLFLFDVGFQLSYCAVFGIVWMQPKIYKALHSKGFILNKISQLLSVSIAAQIAVLPISLYYFHQFPGLFLLSNLVIIPVLGAILIGGILIILLSVLEILPSFLANFYGFIISSLNKFVGFVSSQEAFLFKEISVSFLLMMSSYLLIIFGFQLFLKRKAKQILYFFIVVVLFQSVFIFEKYQRNKKQEIIVFQKSRNSIIGKRIGEKLLISSDMDSIENHQQNLITSYKIGENVTVSYKNEIPNILNINQKNILFIDSLGVYQLGKLQKAIVVLRNSPKINLVRLIKTINPTKIIADGSNYKSYVIGWKSICKKEKINFISTGENGAVLIR